MFVQWSPNKLLLSYSKQHVSISVEQCLELYDRMIMNDELKWMWTCPLPV
jgi:hypothetical protein